MLADAFFPRGGSWNSEGVIIFSANQKIYRVPANGGEATPVTQVNSGRGDSHGSPAFLPDNRHFLFHLFSTPETYIGSLDSDAPRPLFKTDSGAVFVPGYLLFLRQNTLFAQSFNPRTLSLSGDPVPVADNVGFELSTGLGAFSVSSNGRIVYRTAAADLRQLIWFDRSGKQLGTVGGIDSAALWDIHISPDGQRVAGDRLVNGNIDVWLIDVARGALTRFTLDPAFDAESTCRRSPVPAADSRSQPMAARSRAGAATGKNSSMSLWTER